MARRLLSVIFLLFGLAGFTATAIAQSADAREANVSFVRVIRVTQQAYQPVAIRIWEKAPVGHQVYVGYKIFDERGRGVYSVTGSSGASSPASITIAQPYYSTSLTLKWNKIAYDGSRLPRGQRFQVIAYASDLDTGQKLHASSPYVFTLIT